MPPAGRKRLPGPRIPCGVEVAVAVPAELGEGPRWDAATATLLWVDILGRAVHRFDPATGRDEVQPVPALVGFALPRARGGVVLGLPDGLWPLERGATESLVAIEADVPGNRLNDGACDPQGRLCAGTMALDEQSPTGALYRVGTDLDVTRLLAGTTISNGLGWSASSTPPTSSTDGCRRRSAATRARSPSTRSSTRRRAARRRGPRARRCSCCARCSGWSPSATT